MCWGSSIGTKSSMKVSGRNAERLQDELQFARNILRHGEGSTTYGVLRKAITSYCFHRSKYQVTKYNSVFLDVIKAPIKDPSDHRVAVAPDPDAYSCYRVFFESILYMLHGFKRRSHHIPTFYGDFNQVSNLDPYHELIVSIRLECSRNLRGYPFTIRMTPEQLVEVEETIKEAYKKMDEDFAGDYYELSTWPEDRIDEQYDAWSLIPKLTRFDRVANLDKHWPIGRGVGFNKFKSWVIWVNQEDHLRVFTREPYGNLHEAYLRLHKGMTQIDKLLDNLHDNRLGYYTVDPGRLGNGLRFCAHLRVPELARYPSVRFKLAHEFKLYVTRTPSKHADEFEFSQGSSLGCSEFESVTLFQAAVTHIMETERQMELDEKKRQTKAKWQVEKLRSCIKSTATERLETYFDLPPYEKPTSRKRYPHNK